MYYTDYNHQCSSCDSSCDSRLVCTNKFSCLPCYFAQCSNCTGPYLTMCNQCSNNQSPPFCCRIYCVNCEDPQKCLNCYDPYFLYNGTCLNNIPYGGNSTLTTPVISIVFERAFTGNFSVFQAGSNFQYYYFYNDPRADTPIPSKNRGLYFLSSSTLTNMVPIYFPHTFSIAILVKPTGLGFMNLFNIPDMLVLQPFGTVLTINAQSDDSHYNIRTSTTISQYNT